MSQNHATINSYQHIQVNNKKNKLITPYIASFDAIPGSVAENLRGSKLDLLTTVQI